MFNLYKLTSNESFTASYTRRELCEGVEIISLSADCKSGADKLELRFEWESDIIGVNVCWSPVGYKNKTIRPNWGGFVGSFAMSSAPVFSNVGFDDINRLTIACSDAKNSVKIRSGVIEESARFVNTVIINVDCLIGEYRAEIRIDTRRKPFYKCVEDVVKWWETFDGYEPTPVPDVARRPLYSAWYSFHQNIDIPKILEECRYFKSIGCDALIVDDGWQTDNNERGYAYCGDWQPTPAKVPDMKAFADAVHETGMKFIIWYSVPFVGIHSEAYKRFQDKLLEVTGAHNTFVFDPRYPEVREYLIGLYKHAAAEWGLDGFKLDFIDSFYQSETVKDGMDFVSVYDAVDRLMKDAIAELKAINPDILVEFRQTYIGPLMRTFGNMLRSSDCPNDSYTNRLNVLSLRMTSGNTAVHSDMVMWNYNEPAELAAFQLTGVLFSVPQISVLHEKMPESHVKMLRTYMNFWTKYREVLLDGEMMYKDYAADYTYVSSRLGNIQVGAVYTGRIAYLENQTDEIALVNASLNQDILLDSRFGGTYAYTVADCMGEIVSKGEIILGEGIPAVTVPVNGTVVLSRL